ncbi:hypothetical protein [Streptomyces violascens]|uniref:hypothetical protein n=1 Tax=Streptomyces violascens TaxID=67381 RepID=UPI00369E5CF2
MGGSDGLVVIQWNDFSVVPGGPPPVTLVPAGNPGYPEVHVIHQGNEQVPQQNVTVKLPEGANLKFQPPYQVLVMNPQTSSTTNYQGTVSADGQTLTASHVDLTQAGLSGNGTYVPLWVAVTAEVNAPAGTTQLTFTIGNNMPSQSTPVHIIAA